MAVARGKNPDENFVKNLKEARAITGLSQSGFADQYGIKVKTLQSWEIGRSIPKGLARTQMDKIISDLLSKASNTSS
ncbi:MAG: hypothetical protein AAGA64_07405 [Bacteroidota bacterium]